MPGVPVTTAEVIKAGMRRMRDDIFVARAGRIESFDPETGLADVKPMIKHALYKASGGRVYDELPTVPAVPVIFPRFGDFVLSMPVSVGDPCLLLFLDVSHAEWIEDGELAEPRDAQRHSLGWPVAIPGLFPLSAPMSTEASDLAARAAGPVFGEHGGPCRIELVPGETDADDRIKLHADATEFVALANKVDAIVDAIANATGPDIGAAIKAAVGTAKTANGGSVAAAKTKAK